jgi:hypothetical protein
MADGYRCPLDEVAVGDHRHFLKGVADLELKILHDRPRDLDV